MKPFDTHQRLGGHNDIVRREYRLFLSVYTRASHTQIPCFRRSLRRWTRSVRILLSNSANQRGCPINLPVGDRRLVL